MFMNINQLRIRAGIYRIRLLRKSISRYDTNREKWNHIRPSRINRIVIRHDNITTFNSIILLIFKTKFRTWLQLFKGFWIWQSESGSKSISFENQIRIRAFSITGSESENLRDYGHYVTYNNTLLPFQALQIVTQQSIPPDLTYKCCVSTFFQEK